MQKNLPGVQELNPSQQNVTELFPAIPMGNSIAFLGCLLTDLWFGGGWWGSLAVDCYADFAVGVVCLA